MFPLTLAGKYRSANKGRGQPQDSKSSSNPEAFRCRLLKSPDANAPPVAR